MGGPSSESSISLKSGRAVLNSLRKTGLKAEALELSAEDCCFFKKKITSLKPDICFLALHGRFGEDGEAQEILDSLPVAYTGSGPEGSLQAFNKLLTKEILVKNNISTPIYYSLKRGGNPLRQLALPLVVKPACQGSTIGVTLVDREEDMARALDLAFSYGENALVESYIRGREMTVGILGETALPVIEIKPHGNYFDYEAKYHDPNTGYIVPAPLSRTEEKEIRALGLSVHQALELRDFSRVDLILAEDGRPYVLEANNIPGLSERSLFPKACQAAGISFEKMCLSILEMSLCREKK